MPEKKIIDKFSYETDYSLYEAYRLIYHSGMQIAIIQNIV